MQITTLAAVPGGAPSTVADDSKLDVHSLNYLRVRLLAAGGIVSVRPWYYKDSRWWPLRYDGAGVGVAAVTADPANLGGKSEGVFHTVGLSSTVVLVLESGVIGNVSEAHLDIANAEV